MKNASRLLCYALPGLLTACASPQTPSVSGETVRAALARQVIALPSAAPVSGIDGAAALQAQQTYRKSFAEREPAIKSLAIGTGAQK